MDFLPDFEKPETLILVFMGVVASGFIIVALSVDFFGFMVLFALIAALFLFFDRKRG